MSEQLKWVESTEAWSSTSTPEEQNQRKNSLEYSNTLIQVNNILDKVEQSDEVEQEYRDKLVTLNSSSLEELSKQDTSTLENLLTKPQNEINAFPVQAQIDKLEKKGLENLTDEEFVKYSELSDELIAIKDSNIEIEQKETEQNADLIASKDAEITKENNKQSEQEKLIAIEKAETKARLTKVEERLSSIEGSLDSLKNSSNENANKIFSLIWESKEFNKWEKTNPEDISKMEEKLAEIVELLKNPWTLKSITDDLGWANTNNPKYIEFRKSMIAIDPSFEPYFSDLEQIEINPSSFSLDEISNWIEKDSWWMVDIDLKASDATSKLSLIGGKYSFDEKIDKQELDEVMWDSQEELKNLKDNFGVIQEFESSFLNVRDGLGSIWWKPTFKEGLKELIQNFSNDVFNDFDDVYKNMNIDPSMQIKESDITSLGELDNPWDLWPKMKIVYKKIEHHQTEIAKNENSIVQKYETEFKDILKRKTEDKEKQLETLKFLRASGFDELPKWISNKVIKEVQGNVLTIPGLELARENIDLKNGNFWESGVFSGKEDWLNIESKTNLVKLVNKIISWDVNEPLWVEAIANGTTVADPRFVRSELMWVTRKGRTSWHYSKIIENLKKENR